ncbi:hypothetical protein J6590_050348 [Homalodisca vitripennis]|nr:hypothetical protein J6590_050348 [Homalodisca vitripennis]
MGSAPIIAAFCVLKLKGGGSASEWASVPPFRTATYKKLLLYTMIVRLIAWYPHTSETATTALETFQNRSLCQLMNAPWFVRNTIVLRSPGVPTLRDFHQRPGEGHACNNS